MKILNYILILIFLGFQASAQKWEYLFDGSTLNGWTKVDPPVDIKVEEGSMKLHMTPFTKRHAFIRTNASYQNFILELEFRRDRTMDSGILFRAETAPDSAFSGLYGYQVKIDPQVNRNWTGGIMTDFGNGYQWLNTLENNATGLKAEKEGGEWNTLRVEALGEKISVFVNGIATTHLLDDKYKSGFVAFKFHYLTKNEEQAKLELAIKNIKILTENVENYVSQNPLPITITKGVWKIKYFR